MTDSNTLADYFSKPRHNTVLSWVLVGVLVVSAIGGAFFDRYEPVLFSVIAILVIVTPPIKLRDVGAMPPWYFIGLICLPILWDVIAPVPLITGVIPSLALATIGLLIAVELDRFTPLRLAPWFAAGLTALFTMAMVGLLNILRWSLDVLLGTTYLLDGRTQDAINAAVMIEFIYATIAGMVAGMFFHYYFQRNSPRRSSRRRISPPAQAKDIEDVEGVILSDRLGISVKRQRQLVRIMQLVLVSIFIYGLLSRQIAVVVNAALAFGITFIPALLERDLNVPIEPGLVLWVSAAVFLHALGTAGLYDAITRWDFLTHTLSATVVAATGYAALRAIHLHSSSIHFPRWAMFVFLMVFMLAMSVIWEILEFFVDQGALLLDMDPVLAQYGINDTIVDMLFNVVGAIIFATWGTVYLTEVSDSLASTLEEWFNTQAEDINP